MNELKYVIVIPRGMNERGARAIIFNGMITHSSVVEKIVERGEARLHSAGFCSIKNGDIFLRVKTWGKSESLNLESKKGDDNVIIQTLNGLHTSIGIYGDD